MMNIFINTYKCCKSPVVASTITLPQLLSEIKGGHSYKPLIEKARAIGKGNYGFDQFKELHIPTYTVNATFKGSRKAENLESPTGLLYIDLDKTTDIDKANPLFLAVYKSVSGTGMTGIIRVKNLSADNIKPCYTCVEEQLGVELDHACADIARQTVFSFDPDIVVNPNSIIIDANDFVSKPIGCISPLLKNGERRRSNYMYPYSFQVDTKPLFWNENHKFNFDGKDFLLYDKKVATVEVYIPQVIPTGKRYMTISVIINNLCYLNPNITDRRIRGLILMVNDRCEVLLGKEETEKIFREVKSKIESGTLTGIATKLRKIIFSPNCPPDVVKRMRAVAGGMVRTEKTYQKIMDALDDWDLLDGCITNKKLCEVAKVHLNTLKKYFRIYPELRDKKTEINELIREHEGNINSKFK